MLSLKGFHIVFIVASICLAMGFGLWALRDYRTTHDLLRLGLGFGSALGGLLLIVYLWKVVRKI